jgi:hypothetical protein
MDPLSVSASITALLSLAGTIIHKSYAYGAGVRGAPEEIDNFSREIVVLTGILTGLKSLVDALSANGQPTFPPEYASISIIAARDGAIGQCGKTLETVRKTLEKYEHRGPSNKRQKFHSLTGRLVWPFEKERTEEWIQKLERLKAAFSLALSVDEMWCFRTVC